MSHGEAMHEVGRLTAEMRTIQDEIHRLNREKETLVRANDDLSDELTDVKAKLQRAEKERVSLVQELNVLNQVVKARDVAMKKMTDDIAKAQKTIKVQSDHIATPSKANQAPMTPQHLGPRPGAPNPTYAAPPPSYHGHRNTQPSNYANAPATRPPQMARQSSAQLSAEDPFQSTPLARQSGAPMQVQASYEQAQGSFQPEQYQANSANSRRGSVVPQTPGYNSFGVRQIASVQSEGTLPINLLAEHTNLFKLAEDWARNYANAPDQGRDQHMPKMLSANLKQLTNPDIVINLICTGSTRYFAIAKLINSALANFPLRPLVVKGFTPAFDAKIGDIRGQLTQVGMPLHVRRALLVASAEVVREMKQAAGFSRWMDGVIAQQIGIMFNSLEPLFAPGAPRSEAWEDMAHIWHEAVRIGLLQMTKASTFSIDFPPVGSNSRFNPSNMTSRDANFKQDSQTLGQMGVSVRLSITPIVTETDFMSNAVIPKTLHYANVLLQL